MQEDIHPNPLVFMTISVTALVLFLLQLAGQLAQQAVQDSKQKVLVAGSLPPLQER